VPEADRVVRLPANLDDGGLCRGVVGDDALDLLQFAGDLLGFLAHLPEPVVCHVGGFLERPAVLTRVVDARPTGPRVTGAGARVVVRSLVRAGRSPVPLLGTRFAPRHAVALPIPERSSVVAEVVEGLFRGLRFHHPVRAGREAGIERAVEESGDDALTRSVTRNSLGQPACRAGESPERRREYAFAEPRLGEVLGGRRPVALEVQPVVCRFRQLEQSFRRVVAGVESLNGRPHCTGRQLRGAEAAVRLTHVADLVPGRLHQVLLLVLDDAGADRRGQSEARGEVQVVQPLEVRLVVVVRPEFGFQRPVPVVLCDRRRDRSARTVGVTPVRLGGGRRAPVEPVAGRQVQEPTRLAGPLEDLL